MHFTLIIAALVAGALASTEKSPFETNLQKEVSALNLDPVALPDLEFTVDGTTERKVKLTQGKAEGLSEVVRPTGRCVESGSDALCYLSFAGVTITYKAVATQPEESFDVEVITAHSLLELLLGKASDGKTELKDIHLRALHQYVKKPLEFSNNRKDGALFDSILKKKIVQLLKESPAGTKFQEALKKAFAQEPFPTKEESASFEFAVLDGHQ